MLSRPKKQPGYALATILVLSLLILECTYTMLLISRSQAEDLAIEIELKTLIEIETNVLAQSIHEQPPEFQSALQVKKTNYLERENIQATWIQVRGEETQNSIHQAGIYFQNKNHYFLIAGQN